MKLKRVLTGAVLCTAVVFFTGCEKEMLEPDQNVAMQEATMGNTNARRDVQLERFARALASAITEKEVRMLIKEEANRQFDGDYDILFRKLKDEQTGNGKVLNVLARHLSALEKNPSFANPENELNSLSADVPLLNIAVPIHMDKWDAAQYTPLVAVVPSNFDEKTTERVKAFDQHGKVTWLSVKAMPDMPVIVVGLNERVVYEDGTFAMKDYLVDENMVHYVMPDELVLEPGDGGGGGGGGSTGTSSSWTCRIDGKTDYLTGMWFKDISEYEAWILGKPEVVLKIKNPYNQGEIGHHRYKEERSKFDNTWFNTNSYLYPWDINMVSDAVGYLWYEDDGGFEIEIEQTINYKVFGIGQSTKVKYKLKNDDDIIGLTTIGLSHCPSTGYYTLGGGSMEFRFKLKSI